jgi:hypothetical protein
MLVDAYGYTAILPSQLNTFHTILDTASGQLFVQGGAGISNDVISISRTGADLEVRVNATLERVSFADLSNIVVEAGAGEDILTLDYSGGQPIPDGGLSFDGGSQSGMPCDRLSVTDLSQDALAIDPTWTGSDLEYVEIHNPTAHPVNLANWRIRSGIGDDFAAGRMLAPGGAIAVVPFDPADPVNADRLGAFRTHYGLGNKVQIVGAYVGQRTSDGKRIRIERPDRPPADEPNVFPHVLEDEVSDNSAPPWPTSTNGLARSLPRTNFSGRGYSAQSSPGATTTLETFEDFVPQAGDANLDRQFDQKDIVQVLNTAKYLSGQPATFAEGDWNGDGVFDQLDIVPALQAGNYLKGPYGLHSEPRTDARVIDQVFADEEQIGEVVRLRFISAGYETSSRDTSIFDGGRC